jgi:hypothetical protein
MSLDLEAIRERLAGECDSSMTEDGKDIGACCNQGDYGWICDEHDMPEWARDSLNALIAEVERLIGIAQKLQMQVGEHAHQIRKQNETILWLLERKMYWAPEYRTIAEPGFLKSE